MSQSRTRGGASTGPSVVRLIAVNRLHDIALMCCLHLSPASLRTLAQVSCFYNAVASANHVWDRICASLWDGKEYIPEEALNLRTRGSARDALRFSVEVRLSPVSRLRVCAQVSVVRCAGQQAHMAYGS